MSASLLQTSELHNQPSAAGIGTGVLFENSDGNEQHAISKGVAQNIGCKLWSVACIEARADVVVELQLLTPHMHSGCPLVFMSIRQHAGLNLV